MSPRWGQSRNFSEAGPALPKAKAALINKKIIPIPVGYLSKCHWVSGLGIHKLGHSIHPGDLKHLQHPGFTPNQLTQNSALTISHVLLISCLNKESPKPSLPLYTRTWAIEMWTRRGKRTAGQVKLTAPWQSTVKTQKGGTYPNWRYSKINNGFYILRWALGWEQIQTQWFFWRKTYDLH